MSTPLQKSYVSTLDPHQPLQDDLLLYQLFDEARKKGLIGEFVNLESKERMSTLEVMDKADEYAKGLLATGLVPSEDTLTVIGRPTLEAACLFAACSAVGLGYAHAYIFSPRVTSITNILPLLRPKVLVAGEGADGTILSALLSFYKESDISPSCPELPFVERIYYDNPYKNRSPSHKCLQTLQDLRLLGKSVSDEQLMEAKKNVKPDCLFHHLLSSGSTGVSKSIVHCHRGLVNELLQLPLHNLGPALTTNMNTDELLCYSVIAFTLAGKFNKTVIINDTTGELPLQQIASTAVQGVIDENVEYVILPGTIVHAMYSRICKHNIPFPRQKLVISGGQIISRDFREKISRVFGGIVFTIYGATESFLIGHSPLGPTSVEQELRMQARIYPKKNIELRLVDDNNEIVNVGEDGEIQLKTFSAMREYKGQPEKTTQVFTEDGYLRTGDIGIMYSDGTFIIKGRKIDAIRFNILDDLVYPAPIEEVLSTHSAVSKVSVIAGRAHDTYGDELTYCIRLNDGHTEPSSEDIISFCSEEGLNEVQRPCRIFYFKELPMTANARKVSTKKLKKKVEEMVEADLKAGICAWYERYLQDI